jgi:hypothetical protein
MDDAVLVEVIKTDEDLDGEPFDEVEGESLEVVHFDEFVEVDRQHFESDDQVLPKHKLVQSLYDIFLVLRVVVVQVLYQFSLNQALFVKSLFVFEDFYGHELFLLMVIALEHCSK